MAKTKKKLTNTDENVFINDINIYLENNDSKGKRTNHFFSEPQIAAETNTEYNKLLNIDDDIKQQHYYIVKEIKKDKLNNTIISNKDYNFINNNLYTSKTESLHFYNNKVSESSNENVILEYELYIVNDVFFDSISRGLSNSVSNDDIKKYLIIDRMGKFQNEGTNFETYALNEASKKMITNDITFQNNNSSNYIRTNNSFLDGNYKD